MKEWKRSSGARILFDSLEADCWLPEAKVFCAKAEEKRLVAELWIARGAGGRAMLLFGASLP